MRFKTKKGNPKVPQVDFSSPLLKVGKWDSFDKEEKERWTKYPNASLEVFVRSEPIEFVRAMGAVHRTIPNLTPNISKMKGYGKDLDPRKNIFGKKREYELLD